MTDVTWGIASTILAPTRDILQFAAYHLAAGAQRLYIYLDAPNDEAFAHLDAHPKIRVITCDARYWKQRKRDRPVAHQQVGFGQLKKLAPLGLPLQHWPLPSLEQFPNGRRVAP